MLTVQKHFPMWQNHLKANTTGSIFMTKALFLIFSILDLNIYMYVGAHVSRFKYFNINFVFKILFLISVDCIFRASVAAVIFVLNQKQGSFSLPHPLSLPCVQQPHFPDHLALGLCNPMDYTQAGAYVHGILQARILEWGADAFPRDRTWVLHCRQILYLIWATREAPH